MKSDSLIFMRPAIVAFVLTDPKWLMLVSDCRFTASLLVLSLLGQPAALLSVQLKWLLPLRDRSLISTRSVVQYGVVFESSSKHGHANAGDFPAYMRSSRVLVILTVACVAIVAGQSTGSSLYPRDRRQWRSNELWIKLFKLIGVFFSIFSSFSIISIETSSF